MCSYCTLVFPRQKSHCLWGTWYLVYYWCNNTFPLFASLCGGRAIVIDRGVRGGLWAEFVSTLNACSQVFEEFSTRRYVFQRCTYFWDTTFSKKLLWIRHMCCMYLRFEKHAGSSFFSRQPTASGILRHHAILHTFAQIRTLSYVLRQSATAADILKLYQVPSTRHFFYT